MTNDGPPKPKPHQAAFSSFVIVLSSFIRHSDLGIRHLQKPPRPAYLGRSGSCSLSLIRTSTSSASARRGVHASSGARSVR